MMVDCVTGSKKKNPGYQPGLGMRIEVLVFRFSGIGTKVLIGNPIRFVLNAGKQVADNFQRSRRIKAHRNFFGFRIPLNIFNAGNRLQFGHDGMNAVIAGDCRNIEGFCCHGSSASLEADAAKKKHSRG
jgi:hypothetical protein